MWYLPTNKKGDTDGALTLDDQKGPSQYKLENGTSVKGTGTANIKDEVMYYGVLLHLLILQLDHTKVVTLLQTRYIVPDNSASAKPGMGGGDSGALIV